jgi:hypothetical protein
MVVYWKDHKEHIRTLCGQTADVSVLSLVVCILTAKLQNGNQPINKATIVVLGRKENPNEKIC